MAIQLPDEHQTVPVDLQLQTACQPAKNSPPKHKKVKRSTKKETGVLKWSEEMVQDLMHQRLL
ncbi:hypothetical protein GN958_ATG12590 [Phytophthora infestans]|uniref:Uncharacterized protein n=1 Tax=Phytophthora infestans TaxID=4787 RepID=A0A8S9UCE7_PHYIN|nr:hypothetical protein GN958_ATG12590 [Phytophthora infestans]